jgi:flagellar basal-body rod protein FlgB
VNLLDLTSSPTIRVLELTAKFAGERQRVIASNIANIDTPNFQPTDLSPELFQRQLRSATERRRESSRPDEPLVLRSVPGASGTQEVRVDAQGQAQFTPTSSSGNILFHDRNNRDLERMMQANAENVAVFRVAVDLLRSRYEQLRTAMSERV